MMTATYPGAQTERRGGAGPVGGLLGGKDPTGRFALHLFVRDLPEARHLAFNAIYLQHIHNHACAK
jgi:hypothetical protein